MFLHPSSPTIAGLFSIFALSSALPFFPHPPAPQPEPLLIPRASYSVVPVDGGAPSPTAGGSPGSTTTVIELTTQTPAPQSTITIVSTEIVPAGTQTLTSTATITPQDTTEIYFVTVTPITATVTLTAIEQQTTTISSPGTTEYFSTSAKSTPAASTSSNESNASSFSTVPTPKPSISSSTTYDDGLWHTKYPVWSNSSSTTVSSRTSLPTTILN